MKDAQARGIVTRLTNTRYIARNRHSDSCVGIYRRDNACEENGIHSPVPLTSATDTRGRAYTHHRFDEEIPTNANCRILICVEILRRQALATGLQACLSVGRCIAWWPYLYAAYFASPTTGNVNECNVDSVYVRLGLRRPHSVAQALGAVNGRLTAGKRRTFVIANSFITRSSIMIMALLQHAFGPVL